MAAKVSAALLQSLYAIGRSAEAAISVVFCPPAPAFLPVRLRNGRRPGQARGG
jgi:hypothetical protein